MNIYLVIDYNNGEIVNVKKVEAKKLDMFVRDIAKQLIDKWDMENSDFIITRENRTIYLELPISKEDYGKLRQYGLRREGNMAAIDIPLYEISYSNSWENNEIVVKMATFIAPYINKQVEKEIIEYVRISAEEV